MARVPGCVEYDDPVGTDQVDPEAAGPGGDQEQVDRRVGVEGVDEPLPLQGRGTAVKPVVAHTQPPPVLRDKTVTGQRLAVTGQRSAVTDQRSEVSDYRSAVTSLTGTLEGFAKLKP